MKSVINQCVLLLLISWAYALEFETVANIVASGTAANEAAFSCALLNSGHIKCVGSSRDFKLGYGDEEDRDSFAAEGYVNFGDSRTVQRVYLGQNHYCVQLDNDGIKCVGRNANGELGYEDNYSRPQSVAETGDALPYVDIGNDFVGTPVLVTSGSSEGNTCIVADGKLKCWGAGSLYGTADNTKYGGSPNTMGNRLPFIDFGADVGLIEQVSMGVDHACVMFHSKKIKCFGAHADGDLGYGSDTASKGRWPSTMGDKLPFVNIGARVPKTIHAFGESTCVHTENDEVVCWGKNSKGVLGTGTNVDIIGDNDYEMGDNLTVVNLGSVGETVNFLSFSYGHWCALFNNGKLKCIGDGYRGALGDGKYLSIVGDELSDMGSNLEFVDLGPEFNVTNVILGKQYSFAMSSDGRVKAWGYGETGNTGKGDRYTYYTLSELASSSTIIEFGLVPPTSPPTLSPSKSPTTSPTLTPSTAPTTLIGFGIVPPTSPATLSPSKSPTTSPTLTASTAPTPYITVTSSGSSFGSSIRAPEWWAIVSTACFTAATAFIIHYGRRLSSKEPVKILTYCLSGLKTLTLFFLSLYILAETYEWLSSVEDIILSIVLGALWISTLIDSMLPFAFKELSIYSLGHLQTFSFEKNVLLGLKSLVVVSISLLAATAVIVYMQFIDNILDNNKYYQGLVVGSLFLYVLLVIVSSMFVVVSIKRDLQSNAASTNYAVLSQRQKACDSVRFYSPLTIVLRTIALSSWFYNIQVLENAFLDNTSLVLILFTELCITFTHARMFCPLERDLVGVLRTTTYKSPVNQEAA